MGVKMDVRYPRDFTRVPIFSPLCAMEQMRRGRRVIKSAFGQFLIYGMATATDEEVLLTLIYLRDYQVNGSTSFFNECSGSSLLVAPSDVQKANYLRCKYSQIENALGWIHGVSD